MKTHDKGNELIIEPTEPENVTIPRVNVNQSPFYKGEDNQYHCDYCAKSFDKFTSLRSHVLRKKAEGHGVWLVESPDGLISIGKKGKQTKEPPQREVREEPHQEVTEPLPDELEHLETLLKEHGVTRRAVVLRSMALRDPASMQELMWSLDDIGVAKSRQRRIITDYSKWLGVAIPQAVIENLSPTPEYESPDRFGRRPTAYEEAYEDPRKAVLADMELSELIETKKAKIQAEIENIKHPRRYADNSETATLREEIKALRTKLDESEKRRVEDQLTTLREELKEVKENQSRMANKFSVDLKRWDTMEKVLMGLFTDAGVVERTPPKRMRTGKSNIVELVPEEYVS